MPLYYSLFLHVCFSFFTYLSILEFIKLNPSGNVPVLVDGDTLVADSFAILMVSSYSIPIFFYISIPSYQLILHFLYYSSISQYLEDKYPHHYPLLPQDIHKRAINYQVLSTICFLYSFDLLTITLSTTTSTSGLYLYSCHFRRCMHKLNNISSDPTVFGLIMRESEFGL